VEQAFEKDMKHAEWDKVYARQQRRADLVPEWMDAIHLKPGDRILEVGAGPGYVSLLLADRVGPNGLVYAVDPSPDALAYLESRQKERGITQIRRIAADAATLQADLQADCAFVTMVLHHVDDGAALLRNIHRLLRPRALVLVAEFHPDGPCEHGARQQHRIPPAKVQAWCEDAGLVVVEYRRHTPEHYIVIGQVVELAPPRR
jgi:ubiquinone/menaquinone biosynthesis C-methylase UbiE